MHVLQAEGAALDEDEQADDVQHQAQQDVAPAAERLGDDGAGGEVASGGSRPPGLTGPQRPLSLDLPRQVHRLRSATRLPVAVGIGVSTPDQAAQVSAFADAVVVGSAVIHRMVGQPTAAAEVARPLRGRSTPHPALPSLTNRFPTTNSMKQPAPCACKKELIR
ncbi:tryptophan synthase subunit alpha [Streptomyces sp. NPDC001709]